MSRAPDLLIPILARDLQLLDGIVQVHICQDRDRPTSDLKAIVPKGDPYTLFDPLGIESGQPLEHRDPHDRVRIGSQSLYQNIARRWMIGEGGKSADGDSSEASRLIPGRFDEPFRRRWIPYTNQLVYRFTPLGGASVGQLLKEIRRVPLRGTEHPSPFSGTYDGLGTADTFSRDLLPLVVDRDLLYIGHRRAKIPDHLPG